MLNRRMNVNRYSLAKATLVIVSTWSWAFIVLELGPRLLAPVII